MTQNRIQSCKIENTHSTNDLHIWQLNICSVSASCASKLSTFHTDFYVDACRYAENMKLMTIKKCSTELSRHNSNNDDNDWDEDIEDSGSKRAVSLCSESSLKFL